MSSRAVKLSAHGANPYDVYELVTEAKPQASPGNIVVRMTCMPVNPSDLQPFMWAECDLKAITVGGEGAGVVDEVGEGVTKFRVGQRVIPLVMNRYLNEGFGVWKDYLEIPAVDVIAVPDDFSDELAGQFFINPWLAYGIVKEINVPKGEYLVQTAAASIAGRQIVQLAKHMGVKTINVVRRDDFIDELKALGADEVINSEKEDVLARVKAITGGKLAYGAIDAVAGETTKMMAQTVRSNGEILVYGRLSSNDAVISLKELIRNVGIRFFMIDDFGDDLKKRNATAEAVFDLLRKKVIAPVAGKKFPLEKFKEAMKESQKQSRGGKVLIVN